MKYPLCQMPKNVMFPYLAVARTYEEACEKAEKENGNVIFKKRGMYAVSRVDEAILPQTRI